MRLLRNTN